MAHIRTARLVCDKCGAETDIDPRIDDPFGSSFTHHESNYSDWGYVEGRHFCPDCLEAYNALKARHEQEMRDVFGI